MTSNVSNSTWWGKFGLGEEESGRWRIGPACIWIYRSKLEWRILTLQNNDQTDNSAEVTIPVDLSEADPKAKTTRYSFRKTGTTVSLQPLLPDRAVVGRPEVPFHVLSGEDVTLYISTPLWIAIEVGEPARRLQEVATYRLSDTWFGLTPREGELCYAMKLAARLNLADVPLRLHRAVTPLVIRNKAKSALFLERVKLPVQYLSLYRGADNHFWTQAITLERQNNSSRASVKLARGAPKDVGKAELISGPRQQPTNNLMVRAFSALVKERNGST